jgi:hypothetical protein
MELTDQEVQHLEQKAIEMNIASEAILDLIKSKKMEKLTLQRQKTKTIPLDKFLGLKK